MHVKEFRIRPSSVLPPVVQLFVCGILSKWEVVRVFHKVCTPNLDVEFISNWG
jgi:hypothetical protein